MTLVPRFALPLRIVGASFAVNEQDSLDDVAACVETVIRYPQGFRVDLPEFGLPDQAFRQGGADPDVVRAALDRWEPRANALVEADAAALADYVSALTVTVERRGEGG